MGRLESVAKVAKHLRSAFLCLDVLPNCDRRDTPRCANIVRARPQVGQSAFEIRKLLAQCVGSKTFQPIHDLVGRKRGREAAKQVNVIGLDREVNNLASQFFCLCPKQLLKTNSHFINQDRSAVFWDKNEMISDLVDRVACSFVIHKLILAQARGGVNSPPR